jgi:stage III sporulation protein SpoIIIAA
MKVLEHITLPRIKQVADEVLEATQLGKSVLITGDPGCGMTQICRDLQSLLAQKDIRTHRYLFCRENDALKAIRDLCYSIERSAIKGDWRLHSMGLTIRMLSQLMKSRDIAVLILDRADLTSTALIEALFQSLELSSENGHDCGVILTASVGIEDFTRRVAGVSSPLYKHCHVPRLDVGDTLALLSNWCTGFGALLEGLKTETQETSELCRYLHGRLSGNLRSIAKFAESKNFHFPTEEVTKALINEVMAELTPRFALQS